jgi:hypothetical protein
MRIELSGKEDPGKNSIPHLRIFKGIKNSHRVITNSIAFYSLFDNSTDCYQFIELYHVIELWYAKHIEDPTGPESGWQVVLDIYVKYTMTGVNDLNKSCDRSATCKGWALDAARCLVLRGCPNPVSQCF